MFLKKCSKLRSEILNGTHKSKAISLIFVEYSLSLLHHVPWLDTSEIVSKKYHFIKLQLILQTSQHVATMEEIQAKCQQKIGKEFEKFEVIYGESGITILHMWCTNKCCYTGCGKTHYIKNQIESHKKKFGDDSCKLISINETYTTKDMVQILRSIPLNTVNTLYYFNISLFFPQVKYIIMFYSFYVLLFRRMIRKNISWVFTS